jgi:DNA polymerase-3 subunit gamma/tau
LREQANQLRESTVLRLCDLLAVAVEDMRQGGDPRLPLELALVKVTRPAADLSRESLAYRVDQLESRAVGSPSTAAAPGAGEAVASAPDTSSATPAEPAAEPPSLELEQLQEAWQRSILPAVEGKSIPTAAMLKEARPAALEGETLTVEFPAQASFHRRLAEEPKNADLLRDALHELTGRRLGLDFVLGEPVDGEEQPEAQPASEDELLLLVKETFDAREVDDT